MRPLGTWSTKSRTRLTRCGLAALIITSALMVACTGLVTTIHPPICVAGPAPLLDEVVRCYHQNCVALKVIRGEDPTACLIR